MNPKKVISLDRYYHKNRNKPKKRLKKKMQGFFFSLFIIMIVGVIFYFTSPASKLSMIYFEGLNYVSRAELLALTGLSYDDYFLKLDTKKIEADILTHSLITDVMVKRIGFNQLRIEIKEKDIVGCVDLDGKLHYVLSDGELMTDDQMINETCRGIVIYGITNDALKESVLSLFIQSMTELDSTFVNLIKEIQYQPLYGDIHRFSLFLTDGNTINVNSYTMVNKLKYYQTMVNQVSNLGDSIKGIYHLDVGDYFEPYSSTEKVLLQEEEQDLFFED
ncbi:MAG: FtsQ-type POTRA domain-containing protein [Turicibacter sp.]|nr:FtsQ-type POTRA domain-containing protein [Turicibacter sp.]